MKCYESLCKCWTADQHLPHVRIGYCKSINVNVNKMEESYPWPGDGLI